MGAPLGNKNAAKAKVFTDALRRAIAKRDIEKGEEGLTLRQVADVLVARALDDRDVSAAAQIRDTLQGKPTQATELSGPDGMPIQTQNTLNIGFVPGRPPEEPNGGE